MNKMRAAMEAEPTGDVDTDFATMMIAHHIGAIEMAQALLRSGRNEQLRRLAQEIIVTQQQEVDVTRLALAHPAEPVAHPAGLARRSHDSNAVNGPTTVNPAAVLDGTTFEERARSRRAQRSRHAGLLARRLIRLRLLVFHAGNGGHLRRRSSDRRSSAAGEPVLPEHRRHA